jgi:hypothetical protein
MQREAHGRAFFNQNMLGRCQDALLYVSNEQLLCQVLEIAYNDMNDPDALLCDQVSDAKQMYALVVSTIKESNRL